MQWRPIGDGEAVPFGEPVLGWSREDGVSVVVRTSYDGDPKDEWRWFKLVYGSEFSNSSEVGREPTHWMPLPAAPQQAETLVKA
jgi:hypothetical protein